MKKQFLLASVSVIAALAVTSAYAGDLNQTNINQTGTNGQVIIDQTGDGNIAGTSSTDPKAVPSISNSLVQAGKNESLSVTQSGKAKLRLTNDDVRLGDGSDSHSLFSNGGTALVIHAKPDDMKTDPSGNSGDRIACGVIAK